MSFALYMIGYLVFVAGVAWACSLAHVPPLYIEVGAVILIGLGIVGAVSRTRAKDPATPTPRD